MEVKDQSLSTDISVKEPSVVSRSSTGLCPTGVVLTCDTSIEYSHQSFMQLFTTCLPPIVKTTRVDKLQFVPLRLKEPLARFRYRWKIWVTCIQPEVLLSHVNRECYRRGLPLFKRRKAKPNMMPSTTSILQMQIASLKKLNLESNKKQVKKRKGRKHNKREQTQKAVGNENPTTNRSQTQLVQSSSVVREELVNSSQIRSTSGSRSQFTGSVAVDDTLQTSMKPLSDFLHVQSVTNLKFSSHSKSSSASRVGTPVTSVVVSSKTLMKESSKLNPVDGSCYKFQYPK